MIIYDDLKSSNEPEYLTLEESTDINSLESIPVLNSSSGYIVDNDYVTNMAEALDLDTDEVVELIRETNNIDSNILVVVKEEDIIDLDVNPNITYVIAPLSEEDIEYMYADTCIYLSEQYQDDRYLYLLEDLKAFDESIGSWMKKQFSTARDAWNQLTTGETTQQRAIRTGEGHTKELMPFEDRKKREKTITDKVEELKRNENGNNNWHSFNPNDKHEEELQNQKAPKSWYNRKKDDYNELRATGASRFKAGRSIAKDVGKDALELAKKHKKATAGAAGIAAAGLGALALSSPNVRKRITALRNRIMGLEEKNKQGRFSKVIAKLKAILNRLTSKFKRNKSTK